MLAWHDTPVNYVYRFSLVDEFGKSVEAPPSCFAPFEYPFTQSTFSYLSEDAVLPITWGASNSREVAVALSSATSVAEVKEIELQRGTVQFNSERAEKMDIFLNKFFSSDRDSPTARYWFDYVKSPSQLWTKSCDLELEGGRSDKINIVRVTSWFDGKHYREIDSQLVRVVDLTTTP